MKCKNCAHYSGGWCEKVVDSPDQDMERKCQRFQKMTNADRIRAMSDEEFAEMFAPNMCPYLDDDCTRLGCEECILKWLQQPYKEDA